MPDLRDGVIIHDAVIADIRKRQQQGLAEYGQLHRPHNGLDGLVEAYEEALDMAFWLRQEIEERKPAAPVAVVPGRGAAGTKMDPSPDCRSGWLEYWLKERPEFADLSVFWCQGCGEFHPGLAWRGAADEAVHLVGEEDDQNACGLPGPNVLYWRKVTCRDCVDLVEAAERKRIARGDCPHVWIYVDTDSAIERYRCERCGDEHDVVTTGRGAADGTTHDECREVGGCAPDCPWSPYPDSAAAGFLAASKVYAPADVTIIYLVPPGRGAADGGAS